MLKPDTKIIPVLRPTARPIPNISEHISRLESEFLKEIGSDWNQVYLNAQAEVERIHNTKNPPSV